MDPQPVLEGERVLLRPLVEADRKALWQVAGDRRVWEQHPIHDRWQEPVFVAFFDEALAEGGALVAIDRAIGAVIGSSQFRAHRSENGGSMEIGWTFLAPSHWGGGFNPEMKRLMLAHAFASVDRVRFRVGKDNRRSRIAVERLGACLTDEAERAQYKGREVVHLVYEIDRVEFAGGSLAQTV